MALKDKVHTANEVAKMADRVSLFVFLLGTDGGFFAVLNGQKIFQFRTQGAAQTAVDSLNSALAPVLTNLTNYYNNEMTAILV